MARALFIGRFQPFHNAHLLDVKKILEDAEEIIIAIGSSQEKNTLENPFSYAERRKMIQDSLRKSKIKNYSIFPVPDAYNNKKWIWYIRKSIPRYDTVYSGNPWTLRCFRKWDSDVKKIKLIEGISSTKIRKMIISGEKWQDLVPKEVAGFINRIKGTQRIKEIKSKNFCKNLQCP